jgi:hypothetical protein
VAELDFAGTIENEGMERKRNRWCYADGKMQCRVLLSYVESDFLFPFLPDLASLTTTATQHIYRKLM